MTVAIAIAALLFMLYAVALLCRVNELEAHVDDLRGAWPRTVEAELIVDLPGSPVVVSVNGNPTNATAEVTETFDSLGLCTSRVVIALDDAASLPPLKPA